MADINSLTYLVYSILTLAGNNKPTTDPSLNAWKIGSESQVTETWNQEPHYVTRKYNEEDCPAGETWSDCDAGCEETCENVGKPVICPRMCVPGCVCEEPGTVRGPNKKCIHPPLCPSAYVDPYEPVRAEQDPDIDVRVDPYEPVRAAQDPDIDIRVDPYEPVRAAQDPDIERGVSFGNEWFCPEYPQKCLNKCRELNQGNRGKCEGKNCKCYFKKRADEVDPYEPVRADQDPDIDIRVDPYEPVRADQDPDIKRGILRSGGCPNINACTENCKKRGKKIGACQGFQRMQCLCFDHR